MSKFTESFNADRLAYLIQNKERFAVRVYEQCYKPFLIPKKYLQKSSGGVIKVLPSAWRTQLWTVLRQWRDWPSRDGTRDSPHHLG